jgi:AcrR family transcriptional regulator
MRAALLAVLEEQPLEAITGAMIAERAQIGYATFFRHYDDVRALLIDTVATLADDIAARMIPAMLSADRGGAAMVLIREVCARRAVFLALLTGAGEALRGTVARQIAARVASLPDLSPSWLPSRLAIRFAVAATIEVLDWWLQEEPQRDPAEVGAMIERLVFASFDA